MKRDGWSWTRQLLVSKEINPSLKVEDIVNWRENSIPKVLSMESSGKQPLLFGRHTRFRRIPGNFLEVGAWTSCKRKALVMCEGSMQCAAPSAFQAKYPDLQKPPGDRTIFQAINRNSKGSTDSTLDVGGNPATIVFLTNRQFFVPRGPIWQMKAAMIYRFPQRMTLRPRHKLGKFTFWGSIDKGVRADSLVPWWLKLWKRCDLHTTLERYQSHFVPHIRDVTGHLAADQIETHLRRWRSLFVRSNRGILENQWTSRKEKGCERKLKVYARCDSSTALARITGSQQVHRASRIFIWMHVDVYHMFICICVCVCVFQIHQTPCSMLHGKFHHIA